MAILGNSGGGKSTLARRLATQHSLPLHEVDKLLWRPGWVLAPENEYTSEHDRILADSAWLIDGLGRLESIAPRIARATVVILVDFPLWQHFWLAAERQIAWARGGLKNPPGGRAEMPSTKALFETIYTVDRDWMPKIRELVSQAESSGTDVRRVSNPEELDIFQI